MLISIRYQSNVYANTNLSNIYIALGQLDFSENLAVTLHRKKSKG